MFKRKKAALFMFVDYLLCFILQLLGLFALSWMLNKSWGPALYSSLFTLVLFGLIYSRAHKAGEWDTKHNEPHPILTEGLRIAAPLAIFNLVIIALYALFVYDVLPAKDVLIKTLYSFPENQPRVATDVFLLDYITPVVRLWFGTLVGFLGEKTSPLILLITPLSILLGGFVGYIAGAKRFYLSEKIAWGQQKIKDKFNE